VTIADLLLKRGAVASAASNSWLNTVGLGALASPYCLVGIVFHLLGLAAWLWTLRIVPLTIAYCCTALQQATIALGAWLWLGEGITPLRWIGITLVCAGVLLLVPNIAASEQHDAKGEHAT
jgi:drug/metabolite transporter (DMT)-like permease